MSDSIQIVEVGARDGLQNESVTLSVEDKVSLIHKLADAGLSTIEAGAFVSPKWVPQMANSGDVLAALINDSALNRVNLPVLTPNQKGFDSALAAGAKEIAIFGAASESFTQKNINCSIDESLQRFEQVSARAKQNDIRVRGYVSCLVACPYEGVIAPEQVLKVVTRLFELGCYEVSLGDTIGVGTPSSIRKVLTVLSDHFPASKLALHCHDTYGMAVANIMEGLNHGIRTFDASVGGAGGCPYAAGASGNVATEDVVYLLEKEGFQTGIDLDKLVDTGQWLFNKLNKPVVSKVNNALHSKR